MNNETQIGFPFLTNIHSTIIYAINSRQSDRLFFKNKTPFINMVAGNKLNDSPKRKILYLNYKRDDTGIYQFYDRQFRHIAGIKEISIDYKNKFGSVKRVNINWLCTNSTELEELTPYFLTNGKTIYLEWGWDSSHSIIKSDGSTNDDDIILGQVEISSFVKNRLSGGMFDCVAGIITNFEVSLNKDGSYDCLTEITTPGFLMEAISISNVSSRFTPKQLAMANFKTYLQSGMFYDDILSNTLNTVDNNNPDWFILANQNNLTKLKDTFINSSKEKNYNLDLERDELFLKNTSYISWGFIEDVILRKNYNIIGADKYAFTTLDSREQITRNLPYLRSDDLYVCMIPQYNKGVINLNDLNITLTEDEKKKNESNTPPPPSTIETTHVSLYEQFKTKYDEYYSSKAIANYSMFDYTVSEDIIQQGQNNDINDIILNNFEFIRIWYDTNATKWTVDIIDFDVFLHKLLTLGVDVKNNYNKFIPDMNFVFMSGNGDDISNYTVERTFQIKYLTNLYYDTFFDMMRSYIEQWIQKNTVEVTGWTRRDDKAIKIDTRFYVYFEIINNNKISKKIKNLHNTQEYYKNINTNNIGNDGIARNFIIQYKKICNFIESNSLLLNPIIKYADQFVKYHYSYSRLHKIGKKKYYYAWYHAEKQYIATENIKDVTNNILTMIYNTYDIKYSKILFKNEQFIDNNLQELYELAIGIYIDEKKAKTTSKNGGDGDNGNQPSYEFKDKFINDANINPIPDGLKTYCDGYKGEIRKILVNSEFFRKTILENDNIYSGISAILNGISNACGNYFGFILSNNPQRNIKGNHTKNLLQTSWFVFDINSELPESAPSTYEMLSLTGDNSSPSIFTLYGVKNKLSNATAFSAYYANHASDIYAYGSGDGNLFYNLYKRNNSSEEFIDEFGYQNDLETNLENVTDIKDKNPFVILDESMKSDEQKILRKHYKLDKTLNYLYTFLPLYGAKYNFLFSVVHNDTAKLDGNTQFYLRGTEGMKIGLYNSLNLGSNKDKIIGLIPIEIELGLLGMSGFRIGDCFKLAETPKVFQENGVFQIINISDTVSKEQWITRLTAGFRVMSDSNTTCSITIQNAEKVDYIPKKKTTTLYTPTGEDMPYYMFALLLRFEGGKGTHAIYGVHYSHGDKYNAIVRLYDAGKYDEAIQLAYEFANTEFWKKYIPNYITSRAVQFMILRTAYHQPIIYNSIKIVNDAQQFFQNLIEVYNSSDPTKIQDTNAVQLDYAINNIRTVMGGKSVGRTTEKLANDELTDDLIKKRIAELSVDDGIKSFFEKNIK